jgi:alpha-L-fucosidase 2
MRLNRRQVIGGGLAAVSLYGSGVHGIPAGTRPAANSPWILWYRHPARRWVEALPTGNGRLGGMVFGGTGGERIQLNEDTFWAGGPYDPSSAEARSALPRVRELIRNGRFGDAQALAEEKMMARPIRQMSFQTLGDLLIDSEPTGMPRSYSRWLDLDEAVAVADWHDGDNRVRRIAYVSAADNVLVVEYSTEGSAVDATVRLSLEGAEPRGDELWLEGRNLAQHGIPGGLRFAVAAKVISADAEVKPARNAIRVTGARAFRVLVSVHTSYGDWRNVDADPVTAVRLDLDRAAGRAPEQCLARHRAAHRTLFRGFDIDLGPDPFPDIPTDERIRFSHDANRDDPYLAALYIQFARYLLISSSRPGCQPANLQGLWNDSNEPAWGSKYTININTEMNYWPAEPTGLGPCVEPLIRMVEELAESGARTAKVNYGARGWVTHHNTDLWRASAPIDAARYGLWPTGGAWLCKHLWDRWDFSRDESVLRRIYPLMRDAGLFFLDTLVETSDGDGLVTSPSMSPENEHRHGISICEGPAMDRQILRELFSNIIEASRMLDLDDELRQEFASARERLPEDRIGAVGQLQEWLDDWDLDVPEIQHRHVSHLYALHPGHAIGPETPDRYAAARRSLEIRGDDATGWGIGWRINLWARLGDSERAYNVLRKLLGPDRTYPNMFDAHPPFQIDGNFGGAAGILEMLVRDRPQCLEILPALPDQWPSGFVDGLRLRGCLRARLAWSEGRLTYARFTADKSVSRNIRYSGTTRRLEFEAGQTREIV